MNSSMKLIAAALIGLTLVNVEAVKRVTPSQKKGFRSNKKVPALRVVCIACVRRGQQPRVNNQSRVNRPNRPQSTQSRPVSQRPSNAVQNNQIDADFAYALDLQERENAGLGQNGVAPVVPVGQNNSGSNRTNNVSNSARQQQETDAEMARRLQAQFEGNDSRPVDDEDDSASYEDGAVTEPNQGQRPVQSSQEAADFALALQLQEGGNGSTNAAPPARRGTQPASSCVVCMNTQAELNADNGGGRNILMNLPCSTSHDGSICVACLNQLQQNNRPCPVCRGHMN